MYCRINRVAVIIVLLILLKWGWVAWGCAGQGSVEGEKEEVLERRNWLVEKLVTTPKKILGEMPASVGEQFQGEWALYSCSMLSAALVNISACYPETRKENLKYLDSLVALVKSPELRYYDELRWDEDPLYSLDGDDSHISYLSHLAWMIGNYKQLGGGSKYDRLYNSLCRTMNRRILATKILNLQTYPDEPIYIPDMLVAIVALKQYSDRYGGKYRSTVNRWLAKAKTDWRDKETGLLVSFLQENGCQFEDLPVKGSYTALNCYYLTLLDVRMAREQYGKLKQHFWKEGWLSGLKEYYDRTCYLGFDIDAGPIFLELSPSGTAFMAGAATFFKDTVVRNEILHTAEVAGHSFRWNEKRHYLLANAALVGEAIMLAMRTNYK